MSEVVSGFNYKTLDLEVSVLAQQRAEEIRGLARRVANDFIEIGRKLSQVKRRLPFGSWLPWLGEEFGWDERTAQRYIRVAEAFGDADVNGFTFRALDILASASTPQSARTEAVELAAVGEPLNEKKAAEIKRKYEIQPGESLPVSGTDTWMDGEVLTVTAVEKDMVHGTIDSEPVMVLPGHIAAIKPRKLKPKIPSYVPSQESAEFWRQRCLGAESLLNKAVSVIDSRLLGAVSVEKEIRDFLGDQ